ncbi:MAG: HU family DNA-binding protein [Saprospiraceae bacterium]|nr:HU family DNA-binding protein [Bacteroidia bacterium]NNE15619.1 HU family DNA-binding protein [Saprospiraceae bacterium]NNL91386.1 HU family DNA-binding protein [Saprospiraceae bacterium]
MNKGDLIKAVAESANLSQSQASDAVQAVFDSIESTLKSGDKGSFIGFGTFSTSHRPARDGRNPATGETIKIKAKTVVKFKPGKALSEAVN